MTLDEWMKEIDACAQDDLYFEVSGEDAGDLWDQINHLKGMWQIEMKAASAFYAEVKQLKEKVNKIKNLIDDYSDDGLTWSDIGISVIKEEKQ